MRRRIIPSATPEQRRRIPTDKAVRPVGILGRAERVAEGRVLALEGGPTTFVAVRFGTRDFMLLSEVGQLVLQAGAMGKGGEALRGLVAARGQEGAVAQLRAMAERY